MTPACWEWSGARTARGYGRVRIGRREFGAHRVALVVATGKPLGDGAHACHACDTPPCVNPGHLFHGDAKVNALDMISKGRRVITPCVGENNGQSKLTEADVRWMRAHPEVDHSSVASALGVSVSLVRQVRRGVGWRWVA
ncbi:hypothetical protein AVW11_03830 [Streptomyces amritsarensis]|uniref:HNH nuclease domain-containing protein n=2 Tax=Streptomyces amritsarensis TaxID=681158 RepID=A0ABX3G8Q8_9ACTN|nr:hypothetical protein AVW11_03830 [Streptomyces amritsarensis]